MQQCRRHEKPNPVQGNIGGWAARPIAAGMPHPAYVPTCRGYGGASPASAGFERNEGQARFGALHRIRLTAPKLVHQPCGACCDERHAPRHFADEAELRCWPRKNEIGLEREGPRPRGPGKRTDVRKRGPQGRGPSGMVRGALVLAAVAAVLLKRVDLKLFRARRGRRARCHLSRFRGGQRTGCALASRACGIADICRCG